MAGLKRVPFFLQVSGLQVFGTDHGEKKDVAKFDKLIHVCVVRFSIFKCVLFLLGCSHFTHCHFKLPQLAVRRKVSSF